MPEQPVPVFRNLEPYEIDAILRRNHVGRIAYSFHDRVDIEPIHYVYDEGWIYGRTSPGTKLTTIEHNYWVAVEVDEVDGIFDWRSVVVRGGFYLLSRNGTPREEEAWTHAVELLRRLIPEALTARDPVPFRTDLFRIAAQEVAGRAASLVPRL